MPKLYMKGQFLVGGAPASPAAIAQMRAQRQIDDVSDPDRIENKLEALAAERAALAHRLENLKAKIATVKKS